MTMDIVPSEMLRDVVAMADGRSLSEHVDALQKCMQDLPQVQCDVVHRFAPGLYIREVTIPAGTLAIGHRQRFDHLNIFLQGKVTILKDDGTTERLEAPMMFVGKPGRKVGYIEEDMVWQNIYSTSETDVEKLEEMFLDKNEIWLGHLEEIQRKLLPAPDDHSDFLAVLEEFGITEEMARSESERDDNLVELPYDGYKIKVGHSAIHGKGLIATAAIKQGEVIAPARIGDGRTIAGRYTNHSAYANAVPVRRGQKNIDLVAIKDIAGCHGGMDGEEITINYRQSLKLAMLINMEN